MLTGMLWFDNNPKTTLADKIAEAARYYRRKYGRSPELCLINTAAQYDNPNLNCVEVEGQKISVRGWRQAAAGHMWLGVEENPGDGAQ